MSKRNIQQGSSIRNPNPRQPIDLDDERLEVLTRIRQKMVLPGKEIEPKMIAGRMKMTDNYIRQVLTRRCYAKLSRFLDIEKIVDVLLKEMEAA